MLEGVSSCACAPLGRDVPFSRRTGHAFGFSQSEEFLLSEDGLNYTPEQAERLRRIHERLSQARRELDALIGDAYLRPRASIVPVHFLDLASAVEKLRWAEKEWRELNKERTESEEDAEPHPEGLMEAVAVESAAT